MRWYTWDHRKNVSSFLGKSKEKYTICAAHVHGIKPPPEVALNNPTP